MPPHVEMEPVRQSRSGNKREWGYDAENRRAYVIFGAPGEPIALYEYRNVDPVDIQHIRDSAYDSQALTDLLVLTRTGPDCIRLYPPRP